MTAKKDQQEPAYELMSIEDIEHVDDIEFKVVPMPMWGENKAVRIASISADTVLDYTETTDRKTAGLRMITESLVDKEGNRIGTEKTILMMKGKSIRSVNHLIEEILKLNGIRPGDTDKAKNVSSEAKGDVSRTN